ncbi:MAG TPA: ADOP family duplicated permease [Gemmatimonadaceae bacterium]|nr:ADOP family duplicated permease [Gemmatimonadaceae bacterium]
MLRLVKPPGLVAIAILTLALGIGVATAVYTAVDRVLIAPVPYPNGDRVVRLRRTAGGGIYVLPVDGKSIAEWQARARSIEAISGVDEGQFTVAESAVNDSLPGARVTPGFLRTLGVRPLLGRPFAPSDTVIGAAPVVLISRGMWRASFHGEGDILGRAIHVDGRVRTIVGVVPDNLVLPGRYDLRRDVLLPLRLDSLGPLFNAYARLRPGVEPAAAASELNKILQDAAAGRSRSTISVRVSRARDLVPAKEAQALKLLFIAACALLAIACANVAGLLIARGIGRQREFAVRRALGAGRFRVAAHVLAEAGSLALVGGALGVLLAHFGLRAILSARTLAFGNLGVIHVNLSTLAWALGFAVVSAGIAGTAPALLAASVAPATLLRGGGRLVTGGRLARRVRSIFLTAEVALAFVLLTGAGLVTHSFVNLLNAPVGFDVNGLLESNLVPKDRARAAAAFAEMPNLMERARLLPGVVGVHAGQPPVTGGVYPGNYQVEGPQGPDSTGVRVTRVYDATPGYFKFLGMAVVAGRAFQAADAAKGIRRVIVNQELAHRLWPNHNPVGLRFRAAATQPWLTVVGVVNDVRFPTQTGDITELQLYMPADPAAGPTEFMLRSVDQAATAAAFRRLVAEVAPDMRFDRLLPTHEFVDLLLRPKRFAMWIIGAFGILAFVLTGVGLYSLIAYNVSARMREMGIRIALGARPRAIYRLVVGQSLRVVIVGVIVGAAAAYAANKALGSLLSGLSLRDPAILTLVPLLLLVAAALAAVAPARRAVRSDPPLRAE